MVIGNNGKMNDDFILYLKYFTLCLNVIVIFHGSSHYTAVSINVVGLNLQTYESRPNGAMGIYCNLHITIEKIYKFVFFARGIFVFLSVKPFLYLFFRRYVVWIILFK